MDSDVVCKKIDGMCSALPVFKMSYSISDELRCKKDGKVLTSMSCDGDIEIPLWKIIAGTAAVIAIVSAIACTAKSVEKMLPDKKK